MKTGPSHGYPTLAELINSYRDDPIAEPQLISVVNYFILNDIASLLKLAHLEALSSIDQRYHDRSLTEAKVEELAFFIEVRANDGGGSIEKHHAILSDITQSQGSITEIFYPSSSPGGTISRTNWTLDDVDLIDPSTIVTFITEGDIQLLARKCSFASEHEEEPQQLLIDMLLRRLGEMDCLMFIFPASHLDA